MTAGKDADQPVHHRVIYTLQPFESTALALWKIGF